MAEAARATLGSGRRAQAKAQRDAGAATRPEGITRRSQVQILSPQPPCPPEKDIGRTNLRAARLLRFFYVQNSSAEKKITEGVGMDLRLIGQKALVKTAETIDN